MWKGLTAAVVALVLGITGGLYFSRSRLAPRLASVTVERDGLQRELTALREKNEAGARRLERLELENSDYLDEMDALYERLDAARSQPDAESGEGGVEEEGLPEEFDLAAFLGPLLAGAGLEEGREDRAGGGDAAERGRGRRGALGLALGEIDDPVVLDRIDGIREYAVYMRDLERALRKATTDEQRAQLRQDMAGARRQLNVMVREQQKYMLSELGAGYGITGEQEQKKFSGDVRRMMQHRLFTWENHEAGRRNKGQGQDKARRNSRKPGKKQPKR